MSTLPALNYLSNAARTVAEEKTGFEDQLGGVKQIPGAGVAETELTIAAGSVTPGGGVGGVFQIDTEADAATDDLTNIVQTNLPDGSLLLIRNVTTARVVTVKHSAGGAGQISLMNAIDFPLDDPAHWLLLKRTGTLWNEVWHATRSMDRMPYMTKTGAYTTKLEDNGKFIEASNGSWTLTLLAAATAGSGYRVTVRNAGTGEITLSPNVDVASLILQPGDSVIAVSTGSAYLSAARGGPRLQTKTVLVTRDISLASGTQAVTGAGFKPTSARIEAVVDTTHAASWCEVDSARTGKGNADSQTDTDNSYAATDKAIALRTTSVTARAEATVQSWDADGLTLDWTKTGAPTGTANISITFRR